MDAFNSPTVILTLRALQFLFAIIVLGTDAYAISVFRTYLDGYLYYVEAPPQLSFLLFCAIWTLLVLAYLIWTARQELLRGHLLIAIAVEALTVLFWFAGFIATAVVISPFLCLDGNSFCGTIKAATAIGAFEWLLFTVTTGINVLSAFGRRKTPTATSAAS